MDSKHVLKCQSISYMTAISTGNCLSKIYQSPQVFQILKNVTFTATSGEVHGILGVSESGKTTLLEALALGAGGEIGGIAMLDNFMLTKRRFNKYCSYVDYRVSYPESLTVHSLLYFQAQLHLAGSLTSLEIEHRLTELMAMFDIICYATTSICNLTISARKRVLTVFELVKDPILTIIDDPISDLSPLSAFQLIYALQFYAKKFNRIIVASFRNVRSDIYHLIGTLTYLFYGEVAYSGPTKSLASYFQRIGYSCPTNENPASYYLSLITVDKESMERVLETQNQAMKLVNFKLEFDKENEESESAAGSLELLDSALCAGPKPSILKIFSILLKRDMAILKSNPGEAIAIIFTFPVIAILFSFFGTLPSADFQTWLRISTTSFILSILFFSTFSIFCRFFKSFSSIILLQSTIVGLFFGNYLQVFKWIQYVNPFNYFNSIIISTYIDEVNPRNCTEYGSMNQLCK
ncbi:unnamed protein product [Caenorhabditis bovis]|uniref:ABC transporter domain-containing protein n=1 Tax=Caenorhabditis bovis TaxID=2654633 RepID=A0A8S1EZL4_9PELO|nr:unnamed protein product [Caenorhabditis bovis]